MRKLRIILADDHPVTLAGVKDMLEKDINLEVVSTASSSSDLVEQLKHLPVDIIITDYSMPGDEYYGDGMRFIEYLTRTFKKHKLLVFTMLNNPMIISSLYANGVFGVIMKHDKLTELSAAIHALRLGNKYYPPNFSENKQHTSSTPTPVSTLSKREYEVIRLFVRGYAVTQIAEALKRSVKTVSTQKRSAMTKLNINTDQELITFCVEHSLFN